MHSVEMCGKKCHVPRWLNAQKSHLLKGEIQHLFQLHKREILPKSSNILDGTQQNLESNKILYVTFFLLILSYQNTKP